MNWIRYVMVGLIEECWPCDSNNTDFLRTFQVQKELEILLLPWETACNGGVDWGPSAGTMWQIISSPKQPPEEWVSPRRWIISVTFLALWEKLHSSDPMANAFNGSATTIHEFLGLPRPSFATCCRYLIMTWVLFVLLSPAWSLLLVVEQWVWPHLSSLLLVQSWEWRQTIV